MTLGHLVDIYNCKNHIIKFSLLVLLATLVTIFSCDTDDDSSDFLIGAEYVYRAPDCIIDDPIANFCYASIEFIDANEVGILPFSDAIYNVEYRVEGNRVIVLYSDFFVDGTDRIFKIVTEDLLIDIDNDLEYVRQ